MTQPAEMWVVGIVIHLAVVTWVYLDASAKKVGALQWAGLVLCFPGLALIAYAKGTGSRHAWLMVVVLGMGSVVGYAAYAGHAAASLAPKGSPAAAGQPTFDPMDPSTLPKLPPPPGSDKPIFGG
jgi:uncharacterized membrane protein (GlpM family)